MQHGPKKGMKTRKAGFVNPPFPGRPSTGLADAKRSYDRYMELARSAASSADTVEMENYYQYADHFYRLMQEQGV